MVNSVFLKQTCSCIIHVGIDILLMTLEDVLTSTLQSKSISFGNETVKNKKKKHSKSVKHWAGGGRTAFHPNLERHFKLETQNDQTLINTTNKLKTSSSLLVYTRTETFGISIVAYKRSLLFSLQKRHVFPLFSYFRASEGNRDGQVFIFNISC